VFLRKKFIISVQMFGYCKLCSLFYNRQIYYIWERWRLPSVHFQHIVCAGVWKLLCVRTVCSYVEWLRNFLSVSHISEIQIRVVEMSSRDQLTAVTMKSKALWIVTPKAQLFGRTPVLSLGSKSKPSKQNASWRYFFEMLGCLRTTLHRIPEYCWVVSELHCIVSQSIVGLSPNYTASYPRVLLGCLRTTLHRIPEYCWVVSELHCIVSQNIVGLSPNYTASYPRILYILESSLWHHILRNRYSNLCAFPYGVAFLN
jgi:hypothetical protein